MAPHQYVVPTRHVLINGEEENGRVTINASDYNPDLHTPCGIDGNPLEEAEENADTNGDGVVDDAEAKAAAAKKAEKERKKAERKAKAQAGRVTVTKPVE